MNYTAPTSSRLTAREWLPVRNTLKYLRVIVVFEYRIIVANRVELRRRMGLQVFCAKRLQKQLQARCKRADEWMSADQATISSPGSPRDTTLIASA